MADKTWAETAWDAVAEGAKGLGHMVLGVVDKQFNFSPTVEDEVTVEVVGQPGASKQELYLLALTAANGIVSRFLPLGITTHSPASLLMIEYDAADNWVRCTMKYNQSTFMFSATVKKEPGTFNKQDLFNGLSVYHGPQCAVVGGKFNFIDPDLPGIPKKGTFPTLPFEGRVILTPCPTVIDPIPGPNTITTPPLPAVKNGEAILTPNPKPPGDNRSRGNVVTDVDGFTNINDGCCKASLKLIPLVFASLSDPGSFGNETFTPPTQGAGGG